MFSQKHISNIRFTLQLVCICFALTTKLLVTYILLNLTLSGDIHPNPGPASPNRRASSAASAINYMYLDLSKYISCVHYNVQSVAHTLDLLYAELSDFDILAFSESWLNPSVSQSNIKLKSFHPPERRNRIGDINGGVMLYVKDALQYKRCSDLEIIGVECIWIELILSTKRVLFGVYYRPPNTLFSTLDL